MEKKYQDESDQIVQLFKDVVKETWRPIAWCWLITTVLAFMIVGFVQHEIAINEIIGITLCCLSSSICIVLYYKDNIERREEHVPKIEKPLQSSEEKSSKKLLSKEEYKEVH